MTGTKGRPPREVGEDWQAAYDALAESGGEITPEVEAIFAGIAADEPSALDRCVAVVRRLESEAKAAAEEAAFFREMADRREKAVARLKQRIKQHLEDSGRPKAITASGRTLALAPNGGKPPLVYDGPVDIRLVPADLVRVRKEIDSEAVRAALEEGRELDFARLGERGTHLRIR